MKTRFGVITPQWSLIEELVERWQYVEKLGFDSVWVADHWVNFMQPYTPWFDAWTLITSLALHTTRFRLGPLISPIPFHNPAFLARKALTVDHISSGTFKGNYYQVQEAVMQLRPVQKPRPPITIGAIRPAMRQLAARHADTWSFTRSLYPFSQDTLQYIRQTNKWMDEYCEQIGREPASLRRSVLHFNPEPGMEFPFESVAAFEEIVTSVLKAGINEIILQYPTKQKELPLFERVSTDVLSKLRA